MNKIPAFLFRAFLIFAAFLVLSAIFFAIRDPSLSANQIGAAVRTSGMRDILLIISVILAGLYPITKPRLAPLFAHFHQRKTSPTHAKVQASSALPAKEATGTKRNSSNLSRNLIIGYGVVLVASIVGRSSGGGQVDPQFVFEIVIGYGVVLGVLLGIVWMIRSAAPKI